MKWTRRNWLEAVAVGVIVAAAYGVKRLARLLEGDDRMAKKPAYDPGNGKPVYSPDNGKPAFDCIEGIDCADCEGHGPITCTVTATGGCDAGGDCDDNCHNAVFDLDWDGGNEWWAGQVGPGAPGTAWWVIRIWCDSDDDTWHMLTWGGCSEVFEPCRWVDTEFEPSGCETDNGNGYPTHAGITPTGDPDIDKCWDDCQPTVALS